MMNNKLFSVLLSILLTLNLFAQNEHLKWYSLKEAIELNKKQPRKFIIDMYTDWCGWCKKMEAETFQHPAIANYIQNNFYPVKFNAETHDTIEFKGKKYTNSGTTYRSPHSLAIELMNNKMSYPTIVYLDEELNLISAVPGYMNAADIEPVLIFFSRNLYKIYPFENFKADFNKTFKDSTFKEHVQWKTFAEGLKSNKKKIIFLTHYGCIDCNIMLKASLQHDTIANYLNHNFSCIQFNILTNDTIDFNGTKYYFNSNQYPFHQLAVALTNGQINLPQMVFLNEQNQLLSLVPGFFPTKNFEMLIHFFNEEAFKKMSWENYVKQFKSNIP
ncbi:MAG: thioredoxin fold domain-containing protein [Bacteroidales bacterium]|nr:thioredoxin fold domain-containing protein [Bacteroidales bacterium]